MLKIAKNWVIFTHSYDEAIKSIVIVQKAAKLLTVKLNIMLLERWNSTCEVNELKLLKALYKDTLSVLQRLPLIISSHLWTLSNCLSGKIGWFDDNCSAVGGSDHKISSRCVVGERCWNTLWFSGRMRNKAHHMVSAAGAVCVKHLSDLWCSWSTNVLTQYYLPLYYNQSC